MTVHFLHAEMSAILIFFLSSTNISNRSNYIFQTKNKVLKTFLGNYNYNYSNNYVLEMIQWPKMWCVWGD